MLRVMRNHRRAARGVSRDASEWESLRIRPVPIDHSMFARKAINLANADALLDRAVGSWDDAVSFGEKFGYRNAQVTVIAPTGTIGLLMDCDTTGVEPDFALVKFKKLAGGGYFKIANQSLRPALAALGYPQAQIDEILTHVMGRLTVDVPMPAADGSTGRGASFREFLLSKGYTSEDLLSLENSLPAFFEIGHAFSAWSMPARVLEAAKVDPAKAKSDAKFNGLKVLGLTKAQIATLNRLVCGTQTVEGAPHLKDAHLPVFDCANRCGPLSTRFIHANGHIRMMAASQPFISGAISKTINLPAEASIDDIGAAYRLSWELGLKANALYRDGSKLSQPLSTKSDAEDTDEADDGDVLAEAVAEKAERVGASPLSDLPARSGSATGGITEMIPVEATKVIVERIVERVIERPMRRRLPDTRESVTHKFNVVGHEGYLIVGLYEDGTPGELFITMAKEGSTIGGLMDSLGTAISVALQYGVPVKSLVDKFAHQRFEPMGMTTNRDIPFAKSLVDYIFRWLGMQFIPGYREANAPKRGGEKGGDEAYGAPAAAEAGARKAPPANPNTREDQGWPAEGSGTKRSDGATAAWGNRFGNAPAGSPMAGSGVSGGELRTGDRVKTAETVGRDATGGCRADDCSCEPGSTHVSQVVVTEETVVVHADGSTHSTSRTTAATALDQSNAALMGDAPACDVCGSITIRNGTCYRCLNCGNSMGCS